MLYISISDTAIEVIQTKKKLFGGEEIISTSRRELEKNTVVAGAPIHKESLLRQLDQVLESAYPKPIKDSKVTLVISDALSYTKRLRIESTGRKQDISNLVVSEASAIIHENPQDLEHFFKPLENETLYTSMPKGVIRYFDELVHDSGMIVTFMGTRSFAMYELVKYLIGVNQIALYVHIEDQSVEYVLYDRQGPVGCAGRTVTKPLIAEISSAIKEMLHLTGITEVTKIILSGHTSLEIDAVSLTQAVQIPVVKLSEYMSEILKRINLEIDTGGVPSILFANPISLLLLTENSTAPNYARDLKSMKHIMPSLPSRHTSAPTEDTLELSRHTPLENFQEDELVEYEDSGFWGKIGKFLIWVILILVLCGLGFGGYYYLSNAKTFSIPFISQPTPTPTITPTPTVIPTPTINQNLKRSEISVVVQNGTTKTGYAKEIADYLDGKKYKKISKSNADNTNYSSTVIKIKDSKKDYIFLIKEDLKSRVDVSTVQSLGEDSASDVMVILGLK